RRVGGVLGVVARLRHDGRRVRLVVGDLRQGVGEPRLPVVRVPLVELDRQAVVLRVRRALKLDDAGELRERAIGPVPLDVHRSVAHYGNGDNGWRSYVDVRRTGQVVAFHEEVVDGHRQVVGQDLLDTG